MQVTPTQRRVLSAIVEGRFMRFDGLRVTDPTRYYILSPIDKVRNTISSRTIDTMLTKKLVKWQMQDNPCKYELAITELGGQYVN